MALSPTEIQTLIDDLRRAKYRRVRFSDGREVEYGSIDEKLKAIADLQAELDKSSATAPSSFTLATYSRD